MDDVQCSYVIMYVCIHDYDNNVLCNYVCIMCVYVFIYLCMYVHKVCTYVYTYVIMYVLYIFYVCMYVVYFTVSSKKKGFHG